MKTFCLVVVLGILAWFEILRGEAPRPDMLAEEDRVARADMKLQWKRELPPRKAAWIHTPRTRRDVAYPLRVQDDLLLIGCEYNGALLAVDLETGDERWRFYTGAPVRVAPVADGKRLFVISDDGFLYALGRDGKLLWRFRGGPSERKVIGHERLISAWPGAAVAVEEEKVIFIAGQWPVDGVYVHALEADSGKVLWSNSSAQYRPSDLLRIVAGKVFVYGYGSGGAYDLHTGQAISEPRPKLTFPEAPLSSPGIEGDVVSVQKHGGRLIVVTGQGGIYCFADGAPQEAPTRSAGTKADREPGDSEALQIARQLIKKAGVREGYAVVLGLKDGALVESLLRETDLRVVAADSDAGKVDMIRHRLDARGLFKDHRLSVYEGDPECVGLPPYIASLITTETSLKLTDALKENLRPYGGTFAVASGKRLKVHRRNGPIEGAGQWTHEFATAANILSSDEKVARAPLGILWYEGPAGAARFYFDGDVDHQSGESVSPLPPGALIVDGRMILQGPGRLGAFDIYTGRLLWETELPEVYGFGGRDGGLGLHSKKHREPWRSEPALRAEIPATHHARATGLNYASDSERVYVCAGQQLLCFRSVDGSRIGEFDVPLPDAKEDTLCWGSVRVAGDCLVATVFPPQNLIDAQCGWDGNGGDWAKDRMPMKYLVVLDRKTGKLLWSRRAKLGWLNGGVAVGKRAVYCIDTIATHTVKRLYESKWPQLKSPPTIYALNLADGKENWRFEPGVTVMNMAYSEQRDLLVVPNRNEIVWKDGAWVFEGKGSWASKHTPGRMWGLRGRDGKQIWHVDEAPYFEPHVLLGDMLIDRYGYSYDLGTGKRHVRTNPLTGKKEPWHFRKGGCNHLVASPTLITWRSAFYDLADHSGLMPLHGMNMGCTPSMLPAGGVLNVPNYGTHHKRSRMTALALVHRPQNQLWTQLNSSREKTAAPPAALRRAGFNFGAPGDRFAEDGTLWLSVTARKSESIELTPKESEWFRLEPGNADSWIGSTGVRGVSEIAVPMVVTSDKNARRSDDEKRRYDVRLHFTEPEPLNPGQRVFTVLLEGKPVVKNLDIVKVAGGSGKPFVRELRDVEIQGALEIAFEALKGQPLLCGVEVVGR